MVYNEARGELAYGRFLVAICVLERARIAGTTWQHELIKGRGFDWSLHERAPRGINYDAWHKCGYSVFAATEFIKGIKNHDEMNFPTHFYARQTRVPLWALHHFSYVTHKIGNHIFYRNIAPYQKNT